MEMQEETTIPMMMKEDVGGIEITTATTNLETIAIAKTNEIDLETNIETAEEIPRAIATTKNLHHTDEIVQSPRQGIEITVAKPKMRTMTKETETEIMIEETETKTMTAKTEIEKTLGKEIVMRIVINLLVEGTEMEMVIIVLRVDRCVWYNKSLDVYMKNSFPPKCKSIS
jgi:hypothetical protein